MGHKLPRFLPLNAAEAKSAKAQHPSLIHDQSKRPFFFVALLEGFFLFFFCVFVLAHVYISIYRFFTSSFAQKLSWDSATPLRVMLQYF
jgi:hypothetical protein